MSEHYEYLCFAPVLAWLVSRLIGIFLPKHMAFFGAVAFALIVSGVFKIWPQLAWPIAIFSPVSLGIAALAFADMARVFGLAPPRWSWQELTLILVVYIGYLFASLGGVAFDPYALGYGGGAVIGLPVVLAGLTFYRKDWLMGGVIVGAQSLWLLGVGSENLFDHLFSVLLIPVIFIGLARRLRGR